MIEIKNVRLINLQKLANHNILKFYTDLFFRKKKKLKKKKLFYIYKMII